MAGLVFLLVFWVLAGACQRNGVGVFFIVQFFFFFVAAGRRGRHRRRARARSAPFRNSELRPPFAGACDSSRRLTHRQLQLSLQAPVSTRRPHALALELSRELASGTASSRSFAQRLQIDANSKLVAAQKRERVRWVVLQNAMHSWLDHLTFLLAER